MANAVWAWFRYLDDPVPKAQLSGVMSLETHEWQKNDLLHGRRGGGPYIPGRCG
jgi:hypothetical protein